MFEEVPGSAAEESKPAVPSFETLADALSGETKKRYLGLEEQMKAIAEAHGGRIDKEKLTSAERLLIDEYEELRALAFRNIGQAE